LKALLLGYSSIARRRVLPALAAIGVSGIDIATRSGQDVIWPSGLSGRIFREYEEAVLASDAELVYVSTVNNLHAQLAYKALAAGRHVVVDKPAALTLGGARALANLASEKQRVLAEAVVWSHHPQIAMVQQLFSNNRSAPMHLLAAFSFPPLRPDNFRHRADLGGGALLDLGPYAASLGRVFFGEAPVDLCCESLHLPTQEVDSAFSVLARYSSGRSLTGHFGTTTAYVNRLTVLGPDIGVVVEPAFTTTPEMTCNLRVSELLGQRTVTVRPADSFALFLTDVLEKIRARAIRPFASDMLSDAEVLQALCRSADVRTADHEAPSSLL
jgi:NDP-hexose-3-ketoreductase